jgi:hypothetical protein
MLKMLLPLAVAGLALGALPVAAQTSRGPNPNEQVGIHTGATTTNGSAVVAQDQNGTHPEGYPGMAPRNRVAGDATSNHRRHHHHRHHHVEPPVQ